ncbi:MAG: ATP-binding protein [Succinivibrio sp.]
MVQPVVKARRIYSRYVANQTLEDFSLRYTARSARKRSSFTVANAALGSISFLALEVIGANIAIYYGLNHLFYALLLTVPLIFLISRPIASYAVRYNVDIDLLTRGAGFGYLGSSITSLVYASFTFIFLAFEATILANMMFIAFGLPLSIGYFVSAVIVIPLILNGFTFISRFQRLTQPLWGLLQLLSIAGAVLLVGGNSSFSLGIAESDSDSFNWLFFGFSVSILLSLVSQIGEQVDYLRFMPERTEKNRRSHLLGTLIAGPGWIVLGGLKIFVGAILGAFLLGQGHTYSSAVDPNYMYYEVFSYLADFTGTDSTFLALLLTVVFVCLCQIKINITNGYAGSLAWSNFFSRLTHTHPGRVVWVFFNVIIAYILTAYGIYSISTSVLSIYSIVAVAWCGTLLADLAINKRIGLSPDRIEFKRAYLYDINPVGFGSMIISSVLGYMAYFGVFGQYLTAFCAPFTLVLTLFLCPLFAFLTRGKYYLAREPVKIEGVQECQICKNHFDGEDLCYCPRYGGYICSLCCTLDSCCFDECKNRADIHHQIESLLPKGLRNTLSKRLMRFAGHLIMYTLANVIVLFSVYYSIVYHFAIEDRGTLQSGFMLCFLLFEFIFCIFSMMFMLVDESRNRAQEEFHNQNQMLEIEVLERKKTEKLLSEAKKNADAANQAKSRYLSGISHELRTPLNTITGYGQILSNADDIPQRHLRAIGIMCRSGDYLADLIEGLLDISKIEAGRLELHYDSVNLKRLIDELTAYFEDKSHSKGLVFVSDISKKLPDFVRTDEKRIRQILINLLSNAVKYTAKGEVYFSVSYRNEVAEFIVRDSGIGIKKEDLKKIFEPFNRLDDAKRQASGTGLGLTITNLLVTIMGGDLEVESTYGEGTTFSLKIKLSKAFDDPAVSTLERTVTGYQGMDTKKYRVLEVDDNQFHRDLVVEILSPVGFIVDTATCPDDVLSRDDLDTFDLFLVDVSMPGHDGWYLLSNLRARKIKSPVIMVSAEASEGNVPESIRQLHNGYIIKPFKHKQLFDAISKVLPINYIYKDSEDSKKEDYSTEDGFTDLCRIPTAINQDAHKECPKIELNDDIKARYAINFEIGYVSGIRKLNNELLGRSEITEEQKKYLDSLLDKMDLKSLQKALGIE